MNHKAFGASFLYWVLDVILNILRTNNKLFSFLPAQNWEILILKIGENRIRSWIWWAHQIWIISAMKLQDYSRRKQNVCFDVLDIPEKLLHFLLRKKSTYLATISESFPISVKITSCEEKKVFSTQKSNSCTHLMIKGSDKI